MTNTRGPFTFFNKKEHIQWQKKKKVRKQKKLITNTQYV